MGRDVESMIPESSNDTTPDLGSQDATRGAPLADRAYAEIKKAIIVHRLKPGQRVSESSLAESMRMGKAPVRAGMSRLVREGLLVGRGPKTTIVAPLVWSEVQEQFHLRVLLEPDAAAQAAGRIDVTELKRLNQECSRPYRFGDPDEEFRFLLANKAFHLAIAVGCRNSRQVQWIEQLQDALMRVMWFALQVDNRPHIWSHGHDELINAITSGDGKQAAEIARRHIVDSLHTVWKVISSAEPLGRTELSKGQ